MSAEVHDAAVNGKHLYNPANLGVIVATSLLFRASWISPGQWGNELAAAVWFVALGGVVVQRARRWDIAWFFLGSVARPDRVAGAVAGPVVGRMGASARQRCLLLFAFFMISDPMTIPNRRGARVGYALIVAAGAFVLAVRAVSSQRAGVGAVPGATRIGADHRPAAGRREKIQLAARYYRSNGAGPDCRGECGSD